MLRIPHRALGLLAGVVLAAPLLTSVGSGPAASAQAGAAAPATAPFSFEAPDSVTAYGYGGRTWTDLGLRLVADGAPFEVRATRASYDDPIRAVWRSTSGDVPLPTWATAGFAGLRRFLKLEITSRRTGFEPMYLTRNSCLNGWSQRVRPDGPAYSPYPEGCWYNPYSLGSVQGVQTGWATQLLSGYRPLHLKPGRYLVTARIAPRFARFFGLTTDEATEKVRLRVVREGDGEFYRHTASDDAGARIAQPAAHAPTGPVRAADAAGPVPDLRSLPAWGMSVAPNGNFLTFSATVWNAGNSPMVVDGFRRDGTDVMDAYQYFFDADGNQTGYQPVGQMRWDAKPSHQHWHFEDFARYSLLTADKVEAVRSKKEAFCLANTDAVDLTVPDAAWRPYNTDLETACGDLSSLSIREVLAAGWGDTYTQYRAGQSFDLRGLPNGRYFVAVIANPDHRLVESSTDNNVSLRRIHLGGTPGARTVRVAQVGMVEERGYGGMG